MNIAVFNGCCRVGIGSLLALGTGVSILGTAGAIAAAALVDAYAVAYFVPADKAQDSGFQQVPLDLDVKPMDELSLDKTQVKVIRMVAAALVITVAAIVISYVASTVFLKVLGSLAMSYNVARIAEPLCAIAWESKGSSEAG